VQIIQIAARLFVLEVQLVYQAEMMLNRKLASEH
jgi:hypothetical protein